MADLARRTQSRSIGSLIASAAAVAVLSEAGSGSDKFLHIGNGVIAVLDTSLHVLTEPVDKASPYRTLIAPPRVCWP